MNFYAPSWDTCKAMECFFSYGGEFFLSQSARSSLSILRTFRAHRKPPAYRVHRALLLKVAVRFCEIG